MKTKTVDPQVFKEIIRRIVACAQPEMIVYFGSGGTLHYIEHPYIHDLAALITLLLKKGIIVPDHVKEGVKAHAVCNCNEVPSFFSANTGAGLSTGGCNRHAGCCLVFE